MHNVEALLNNVHTKFSGQPKSLKFPEKTCPLRQFFEFKYVSPLTTVNSYLRNILLTYYVLSIKTIDKIILKF